MVAGIHADSDSGDENAHLLHDGSHDQITSVNSTQGLHRLASEDRRNSSLTPDNYQIG